MMNLIIRISHQTGVALGEVISNTTNIDELSISISALAHWLSHNNTVAPKSKYSGGKVKIIESVGRNS